jgi:NAD-dependent dihydropyrimidine dehydrogenase PreA subunit
LKEKRNDSRFVAVVAPEQCKGCGKCVVACPRKILKMGASINSYGFRYAVCVEGSCAGCGSCFYSCPEPGAITIYLEDGRPDSDALAKEQKERCQKKGK